MEALAGLIQNYAWGSVSAIAELRGLEPADSPEAELWFGAHHLGSATLPERAGLALIDAIQSNPAHELGEATISRFGPELPYLLKLLAVARPLSIQVHPSAEQAAAGFAGETAAGVPLDAPNRTFCDTSHKPELIVPLAGFEALVGFRPVVDTLALLDEIGAPELHGLRTALDVGGLRQALEYVLGLPDDLVGAKIVGLATGFASAGESWSDEAAVLSGLAEAYPHDQGVLVALLLNRVSLEAGEAVFLPAGTLHCYVGGLAVEIMANSDNVVRAGLTPKHKDVATLLEIVSTEPTDVEVLRPTGPELTYPTAAAEFELSRLSGSIDVERPSSGPGIVLCVEGRAIVTTTNRSCTLEPGTAVWSPQADPSVHIAGEATVFIAAVGR